MLKQHFCIFLCRVLIFAFLFKHCFAWIKSPVLQPSRIFRISRSLSSYIDEDPLYKQFTNKKKSPLAVELQYPKYMVRYLVPRVKTGFKKNFQQSQAESIPSDKELTGRYATRLDKIDSSNAYPSCTGTSMLSSLGFKLQSVEEMKSAATVNRSANSIKIRKESTSKQLPLEIQSDVTHPLPQTVPEKLSAFSILATLGTAQNMKELKADCDEFKNNRGPPVDSKKEISLGSFNRRMSAPSIVKGNAAPRVENFHMQNLTASAAKKRLEFARKSMRYNERLKADRISKELVPSRQTPPPSSKPVLTSILDALAMPQDQIRREISVMKRSSFVSMESLSHQDAMLLQQPATLVKLLLPNRVTSWKQQLISMQSTWKELMQSQAQMQYRNRLDLSTRNENSASFRDSHGNTGRFRNSQATPRGRASRGSRDDTAHELGFMSKASKQLRRLHEKKLSVVEPIQQIVLPSTGDINMASLAAFLDLSPSKVIKYLMKQLGVVVNDVDNIDVAVARNLIIILKGSEYIADAAVAEEFKDTLYESSLGQNSVDDIVCTEQAEVSLSCGDCSDSGGEVSAVVAGADKQNPSHDTSDSASAVSRADGSSTDSSQVTNSINTIGKIKPSLLTVHKNNSSLLLAKQSQLRKNEILRDPVVTIMGHVDHGKTSLLDYIRKSDVATHEYGGITQKMQAFRVTTSVSKRNITFIDTPGHAVFKNMRRRGTNITDLVVLVVAADDGVMEQTLECIAAAKATNSPMLVAVTKVDKEGADPKAVLISLLDHGVVVEDFGGDVQSAFVSSKTGEGIEDLLEKILIQTDILSLTAVTDGKASGVVLDGTVDKKQGILTTLLVQQGTLKVGDTVIAGSVYGKIKRIMDDSGRNVKSAGPSCPVQVTGVNAIPRVGEVFGCTLSEADAKRVVAARSRISENNENSHVGTSLMAHARELLGGIRETLPEEEGMAGLSVGSSTLGLKSLKTPIILKADSIGSLEAVVNAITVLNVTVDDEMSAFDIVSSSVGDITRSDLDMAFTSKAVIFGFNVVPSGADILLLAKGKDIKISTSPIIYELLSELNSILQATLTPPLPGTLIGRATVLKVFNFGKKGKIAGCCVTEGKFVHHPSPTSITPSATGSSGNANGLSADTTNGIQVRVIRNKRDVIGVSRIDSLRIMKDEVTEVATDKEFGLAMAGFSDYLEGDIIECFEPKKENGDI